jgi:hypothetical protein
MITIRETEHLWSPALRQQVKALPPNIKFAQLKHAMENFLTEMKGFLSLFAGGTNLVEPDFILIEDAWNYAFNMPRKPHNSTLSDVNSYHEIVDIIIGLCSFSMSDEVMHPYIDTPQYKPHLVVLYYMLNARIKLDHVRLNNNDDVLLTVRDIQLLTGMRESSIRNAISGTSSRPLDSILINGNRLIEPEIAIAWMEAGRGYKPTDLSQPFLKPFIDSVIKELAVNEYRDG